MTDRRVLFADRKSAPPASTGDLSDELLLQLSEFVAGRMGLHFPKNRWPSFEKALRSAAGDLGFTDTSAFVQWLAAAQISKNEIETLAAHLTVGETFFWRDRRVLEALRDEILPGLVRANRGTDRRLRIWSAGCSTGEEPYTLAILLSGMADMLKGWNISILATDINAHALRKAAEGAYTHWSFRDTPDRFKSEHFTETADNRFEVLPGLRRMVNFAYLNLAEDVYPSLVNETNALDIIVCRNVLMYFTPELAQKAVERFHRCLLDGGWLVVSPCEVSLTASRLFETVSFPEAVLYRKHGRQEIEINIGTHPILDIAASNKMGSVPLLEVGPGDAAEEAPRDEARSLALLCRIKANEGKLTEALELSGQAIASDKLNAGLHYLRAAVLQEQGEVLEAARSLRRALYLDQDYALAHFALGNLALRQGKTAESQRHFENALLLLSKLPADHVLPDTDGISAGRLAEVISSMMGIKG